MSSRHSGNQAKPEHPESPTTIRDAGQASMTIAETRFKQVLKNE